MTRVLAPHLARHDVMSLSFGGERSIAFRMLIITPVMQDWGIMQDGGMLPWVITTFRMSSAASKSAVTQRNETMEKFT